MIIILTQSSGKGKEDRYIKGRVIWFCLFLSLSLYIGCFALDQGLSNTAMIANFTRPEKLLFTKRNLKNF